VPFGKRARGEAGLMKTGQNAACSDRASWQNLRHRRTGTRDPKRMRSAGKQEEPKDAMADLNSHPEAECRRPWPAGITPTGGH
jgi:hypothetical protein